MENVTKCGCVYNAQKVFFIEIGVFHQVNDRAVIFVLFEGW